MELINATAFVTGANRGLGRELATQLLGRGAKVYAGVRDPAALDLPGAVPVQLDVTDAASVQRAAEVANDATLVVNNAGVYTRERFLDGDTDLIHREMEVNYFGPLAVIRAFTPVIEANGGGAFLNILSVVSWFHPVDFGPYAAAKAASWALSNATREELAPRGIAVSAVHFGFLDTEMVAHLEGIPKLSPGDVARTALDGLAKGENEILVDDFTRSIKASLS
jgi:NAD(P)-dependent dehydrogenase (short-subunit alcohol dehydrogenase family)